MKDKLPITALFALLGVVLGGGLQYYSSRTIEFEKASLDYRLTSYRDFLSAQVARKKAKDGTAESIDADRKIRDATLRIAIFSPKEVAATVAEWLLGAAIAQNDVDPCGKDRSLLQKDLSVYHAMRGQAFKRSFWFGNKTEALSDRDMAIMVLGCKLE